MRFSSMRFEFALIAVTMQMRKRRPKHFRIRGPCLSQPINKKAPPGLGTRMRTSAETEWPILFQRWVAFTECVCVHWTQNIVDCAARTVGAGRSAATEVLAAHSCNPHTGSP